MFERCRGFGDLRDLTLESVMSDLLRAMERKVLPALIRVIISSIAEVNSSSFRVRVLFFVDVLLLLLVLVPGRRRISRSSL